MTAPPDFARLACLDYERWTPADGAAAERLLAEDPEIGRMDMAAAAAAGDVDTVAAMIDRAPGLVRAPCGPHGWEPLLYACYSRIAEAPPSRSTLDVARLLLARGADPNAGFLWHGNLPPFTALAGAFGDGEGGASQPPHPRRLELARALLEAGADPNDGQVLYNRHFRPDDAHLELLFAFGLGRDRGGPWYARYRDRLQTPAQLLVEELWSAARRNYAERVRLLVANGAEVDGLGFRDGRTPGEAALLAGNGEIAADLVRHGARPPALNPADAFEAACVCGRREEAAAALTRDRSLIEGLGRDGRIRLVHRAVEAGRPEGIRLMADLGFELDQWTRHDGIGINLYTTPLHNAAWTGNLEIVRLLIELGANPEGRDPTFDATPLEWARYNRQDAVAQYLAKFQA